MNEASACWLAVGGHQSMHWRSVTNGPTMLGGTTAKPIRNDGASTLENVAT